MPDPIDPTQPIPPATDVVGTKPLNPFQKVLSDLWAQVKTEADSKTVRDQAVQGIFAFFAAEFPPDDPILAAVEPIVQQLAETGTK